MVRNITKRMLCTRAVYHVLVVGAGAFLAQRGSRRLMKENKSKRLSAHQSTTTTAEEDSVSQQSASATLFTLSEVAQVTRCGMSRGSARMQSEESGLSPPASPADGAPACLLTPKPAALAVVFPALLQSFLTGANTIPDPWSPFSGRHVESATTFQTRLARVIFQ